MNRRLSCAIPLACVCLFSSGASVQAAQSGAPWPRHVIDASSRGADGVRLADLNGDGAVNVTDLLIVLANWS